MAAPRLHAIQDEASVALGEGDADAAESDSVNCASVQRAKAARAARTRRSIAITSQIFADACHDGHRRKQAGVAESLGVSKTRVSKWCDPDEPVSISSHHLLSLSETCPKVFRLYMARLDQQTKSPAPVESIPTRERATRVVETLGELLRFEREAMADGVLDERESVELDGLWTEAITISEAGRSELRAARKAQR